MTGLGYQESDSSAVFVLVDSHDVVVRDDVNFNDTLLPLPIQCAFAPKA